MIIISNGHSKFILGAAAAEVQKRGLLMGYITAGYPSKHFRRWVNFFGLSRLRSVRRLLGREEAIPAHLVHPLWMSEWLNQISQLVRQVGKSSTLAEFISDYALRLYGFQAAGMVRDMPAKIYHYRSGYGHHSVRAAKKKGMITLCDHSIAHPAVLQYLIENGGQLPPKGQRGPMTRFWSHVLEDIEQADFVIVNSDFVKNTFTHQGWPEERVHVAYTGVDQEFLDAVPTRSSYSNDRTPLRLLFAGEFGPRKGAEVLIRTMERISDLPWCLEVIGQVHREIHRKFESFFRDTRVRCTGTLPRLQLAERMSEADVFVFPSLAEGSARVVFMALACGCYVITTPNAGSIVEDGIHGRLIPPGDAEALSESIAWAMVHPAEVAEIGWQNAQLVRSHYRQRHYGDKVLELYHKLADK